MSIFHTLIYKHPTMKKDGVGEFGFCVRRGPRARVNGVMFLPELPGAQPHAVPSDDALRAILGATDALHAMALLRSFTREVT